MALAGSLVLVACNADLPDRGNPGAIVLAQRCGGCHRVYAPSSMTVEMWRFQLGRMHALFAQRGIPWLTPDEEQAVMAYLTKYAGTQ